MTVIAPHGERMPRMSRRTLRNGLIALVAVLALGGATAAGTWASFTASTSNDSSFATGTLLLSNQVGVATACFSTLAGSGVSTNDRACDSLFNLTVRKPGDVGTTDVTLKGEGQLDGTLATYMAACSDSDAVGTAFHGTGTLCDQLQLTIQEYADGTLRTGNDVTGGNCRVGASTGAGVTCAFGPTIAEFVAAHGSFGSALALDGLTSGQSRYYRVGLRFPPTADNTVQGRQAGFDLAWRLVQQ